MTLVTPIQLISTDPADNDEAVGLDVAADDAAGPDAAADGTINDNWAYVDVLHKSATTHPV